LENAETNEQLVIKVTKWLHGEQMMISLSVSKLREKAPDFDLLCKRNGGLSLAADCQSKEIEKSSVPSLFRGAPSFKVQSCGHFLHRVTIFSIPCCC
jgi:hypothetical protein